MEIKRFFVEPSCVRDGKVYVEGNTYKHLALVLRAKVGYKVIICVNDGKELNCTIESITKDTAVLKIDSEVIADKRKVGVTLYAALLKNSKLDYVIQKAVELGVKDFVPFTSKRTVESKFNIERARTIALESAQQCGSSFLTNIHEPISFEDLLTKLKSHEISILAYEDENKATICSVLNEETDIALVVGPEGGFEPDEVESVKKENVKVVTLGKRILRADTASIVFSALVLDARGELDYDE